MMEHIPERIFDQLAFEPNTGCWLWAGKVRGDGYVRFNDNGKGVYGHRFMYEHLIGVIPEGLTIDHLCRVRSCLNPQHLEPVTMKVNILRGISPFAVNARKTHCVHGHEYTAENTISLKNGRECKECRRGFIRKRTLKISQIRMMKRASKK